MSPTAGEETLSDERRRLERLQLALRTRYGVPEASLGAEMAEAGLVENVGGRSVLTLRGRLLASEVTTRLTC